MHASWLANEAPLSAWARLPWTSFRDMSDKEDTLVILPLHAMENRGPAVPLDVEEARGSCLLHAAMNALRGRIRLLTLPPLRFLPPTSEQSLFAVDFETAHATVLSIARWVRSAGYTRMAFYNTSEGNTGFAATVAVDARSSLGLSCYVIHANSLGLSLQAGTAITRESATLLASLLIEISNHRNRRPLSFSPPTPLIHEAHTPYPPWRNFHLGSLDSEELAKIASSPDTRVVFQTGSIEQHGHHLPVGVDSMLGGAFLGAMAAQADTSQPFFATPPITYGKSNEHSGFPGTLSLEAGLLYRTASAVLAQLAALGFRAPRILNSHGGNTAVLSQVLRDPAHAALKPRFLLSDFKPPLPAQEATWGMHADEWETSLMLALDPDLVRMDLAVCEYPSRIEDHGLLRPEKAPVTFAWLSSDISRTGVIGDPCPSTATKGRAWFQAEAAGLLKSLFQP